MPKSIIVEGNTTKEAIEKGLKELNVSKDMVEIKTLEEEKKRSFYSILAPRVVKIEMTLKENVESNSCNKESVKKRNINKNIIEIEEASKRIEKFLNEILDKNLKIDINIKDFIINVNINGEEINNLIGYRGTTINSLQILITAIANKNISSKIMVILDVGDYRKRRQKTLEELAEKISKTVIKTKKSITLEPMSAFERKIIHTKLQDNDKVKTFSKGEEPHRRLVISLK
jgi:spoIIIJ-associated protein